MNIDKDIFLFFIYNIYKKIKSINIIKIYDNNK